MGKIAPYWTPPEAMAGKGRDAVVAIKILRDGTVIVQNLEQSSGNKILDRLALTAPVKASPLPSPPYEMEIGLRFHP